MHILAKIIKYIALGYWMLIFGVWAIFALGFTPLMILGDINTILRTGFALGFTWDSFLIGHSFMIAISMLVPPLRKIYDYFPWLFPYVVMFFINSLIMMMAVYILNYGYEVRDTARHVFFLIVMLVQIIVCRFAMCLYFWRKPVKPLGNRGGDPYGHEDEDE
mgnify:CR=1 FL=1